MLNEWYPSLQLIVRKSHLIRGTVGDEVQQKLHLVCLGVFGCEAMGTNVFIPWGDDVRRASEEP